MLWLTCPNCGRRPIDEYAFGGELPDVPERITGPEARDVDYVWMFNNVNGVATERWFHHAGCRRWHTVRRDTSTDEVVAAPTDTVM